MKSTASPAAPKKSSCKTMQSIEHTPAQLYSNNMPDIKHSPTKTETKTSSILRRVGQKHDYWNENMVILPFSGIITMVY